MTKTELQKYFIYNPETGEFIRTSSNGNASKPGYISGSKSEKNAYLRVSINNKRYSNHRLAWLYMTGNWPKYQIDHINGNKKDNRWINLREVTNAENSRNQKKQHNNSGITGVYKNGNRWSARLTFNGKEINLGNYKTKIAAAYARHIGNMKYGFHWNHGVERHDNKL